MTYNTPMRLAAVTMAAMGSLVLAACNPSESPAPTPAPSEPSAPAMPATAELTGEWASLQPFIDKYPEQSGLFDNSVITAPLQSLLGSKHEAFKTNMQVQSPLSREGNVLYTSGNKPQEGGINAAYLLIDPTTKTLEIGLWENGKLTTYPAGGTSIAKPADISTMIANAAG